MERGSGFRSVEEILATGGPLSFRLFRRNGSTELAAVLVACGRPTVLDSSRCHRKARSPRQVRFTWMALYKRHGRGPDENS